MKHHPLAILSVALLTYLTYRHLFRLGAKLTDKLLNWATFSHYNPHNWIGQLVGLATILAFVLMTLKFAGPLGQPDRWSRVGQLFSQTRRTIMVVGGAVSVTWIIAHLIGMPLQPQLLLSLLAGGMAASTLSAVPPMELEVVLRGFRQHSSRSIAKLWHRVYTRGWIPWGAGFIQPHHEPTHVLIAGNIGSGKSTFLNVMMSQLRGLAGVGIVPDMRAIVLDAKRDITRLLTALGVPFTIWNPLDIRSVRWDIARDIVGEGMAREFAVIVFADDIARGKDNPYFSNSAAIVLQGIIVGLQQAYPEQWTLRHLILLSSNLADLRAFLQRHHPRPKELFEFLEAKKQGPNEILTTVQSKLQLLSIIAARWEQATTAMSLKEWIKREEVLVLGSDHVFAATLKLVNTLILNVVVGELNSLPESRQRRVWIYIDEATAAGRFVRLEDLVALGRGAGVCVVIAFQNIAAFMQTYSENLAKSILGLCRHWAIFGVDMISAQWISAQIGEYEALQKMVSVSKSAQQGKQGQSHSQSRNQQYQVTRRATVLPQELMDVDRPPTGPESGELAGFFFGLDIPLHFHRYSWKQIKRWQVTPVEEEVYPAYQRVADDDPSLSLQPLTPQERDHLGLNPPS